MGDKTRIRYVTWRGKTWRALADTEPKSAFTSEVYQYGYTRSGGNNPRFRRLIKQGANATNAMTIQVSNAEAQDFSVVVRKRKTPDPSSPDYERLGEFGVDGVFLNVNLPLPISAHSGSSSMSKACSIAVRALNRKVTQRRRAVLGGVAVGELGKTIRMVLTPAKALRSRVPALTARIHRMVRKHVAGKGPSLREMAAGIWLETMFGWKPLLADVKDGAIAVARVATKNALEKAQFRGYGDDTVPSLTTVQSTSVGYDAVTTVPFTVNRVLYNKSECIIYGRFSTKLQDAEGTRSAAERLATLSGFNWEDAPISAWELVPFSFLVDYFTNVGDVLEGCANLYNGIDWAAEVHITETTDLRNFEVNEPGLKSLYGAAYHSFVGSGTSRKSSYRTISRSPTTTTGIYPELRFRLPVGMQWLNLAALAAGGRPPQPFLK